MQRRMHIQMESNRKQRMVGPRRQDSRANHGFSGSAMEKIECKRKDYEGNKKLRNRH